MIVRWLKRIVLGVFLFALALVASISALVATEDGSQWLIARIIKLLPEETMNLELSELHGNLLTGLDVDFFRLQLLADGQATQEYSAEDISFRWQPLALFYSAVSVQSLQAKNIKVILPVARQVPTTEPLTEWPSFALPVGIELGDIEIENLGIFQGEKSLVVFERISGSLSIGNFNFRLNEFSAVTKDYGIEITGRTGVRYPYASDLAIDWHYQLPTNPEQAADVPPIVFSGAGNIFGDLDNIDIEHELKTPFVIESEGSLKPNATLEKDVPPIAPYAELTNTWEDQPLLAQWFIPEKAPLISSATLVVTGWYDNYHALLNGDVSQIDFGNFRLSADVNGNLKNVTIAELTAEQLDSEKNPRLTERATLNVKGEVEWLPEVKWNLNVNAQQFNPAYYVQEWPGNIGMNGIVRGALVKNTAEPKPTDANNAQNNLLVTVEQLTVSGQLRELDVTAAGDFTYQQEALRSDDLRITLGANQLHVSGEVSKQLNVRWQLEAPFLAQIDPGLTGSLSTKGMIKGELTKPSMELAAIGKKLQWQGYAVEELDVSLQPSANAQYSLALDAKSIQINENKIKRITLNGQGSLSQHQVTGLINSTAYGRLNFDLQSHYENAAWKGKFSTLDIKVKKVPRWWLTSGDWITVDAQKTSIGKQCFTTRVRRNNRTTDAAPPTATIDGKIDGTAGTTAQPNSAVADITFVSPSDSPDQSTAQPQLCLQGDWDSAKGLTASASLKDGPLHQARSWLKPDVTLNGVLDGEASLSMKAPAQNATTPLLNTMIATAQLQTRGGELRYQFSGEEPSIYAWETAQLKADLKDGKLAAGFVNDWGDYGTINATADINLAEQKIAGDIAVDFKDLSPLEALLPTADDVQGRMSANLKIQGQLQNPEVIGDVVLAQGAAKLPGIGLELTEIQGTLKSASGGNMTLESSMKSGDGTLSLSGDLNSLGGPEWQLNAQMQGADFKIIEQPQLVATISPDIKVDANAQAINLTGGAKIPYARAIIKALPPSATRVSNDVIIVNGAPDKNSLLAGIPIFVDIKLELGKDVHFSGFGLESELRGEMHIVQSPPRALLTTGFVSVEKGIYKAYGQELTIERGRLLFQGPYDNPGLDIRAVRKTPEYEIGLEIGGTLQKPTSTVIPSVEMSVSESMAILLTGKPLAEAKPGDAYALLSAVSGLGMSDGPGIKDEVTSKLGLDQLDINTDEGFDQSALWIGKYLSPRLFVRYVVGIFDETFSVGLTYKVTDKFELEAESGLEQSIDIIYRFEK